MFLLYHHLYTDENDMCMYACELAINMRNVRHPLPRQLFASGLLYRNNHTPPLFTKKRTTTDEDGDDTSSTSCIE